MKSLYAIIFFLLISLNMSEKCDDKQNPSSISDCKGLELTTGDSVCCFMDEKYTMFDEEHIKKSCIGATKAESENTTLIKEAERKRIEEEGFDGKVEYININCKNNYLFTSFLSLIIILLL